jgi:hypothetical protein
MYVIIVEEGVLPRTKNVEFTNIDLHIQTSDRFADEATCLRAFAKEATEVEPKGWDSNTKQLVYSELNSQHIPVEVSYVECTISTGT